MSQVGLSSLIKRSFTLGALLILAMSATLAAAEERVRIGVLANRGLEDAMKRWRATADYLTAQIPGHRFEIIPLDFDALTESVAQNKLEFAVTNSGEYVELQVSHEVRRIATLKTCEAVARSRRLAASFSRVPIAPSGRWRICAENRLWPSMSSRWAAG